MGLLILEYCFIEEKEKVNEVKHSAVRFQTNLQKHLHSKFSAERTGPTDSHRTEQVSGIYAWQIAISHDLGLKEMG